MEEVFGKATSAPAVYGDNHGALFLIKNNQVSQRAKHIDIRQLFIIDLQPESRNK